MDFVNLSYYFWDDFVQSVKYKLFQDESVHFMDLRLNLSIFMD